jgi:hypothetical protein
MNSTNALILIIVFTIVGILIGLAIESIIKLININKKICTRITDKFKVVKYSYKDGNIVYVVFRKLEYYKEKSGKVVSEDWTYEVPTFVGEFSVSTPDSRYMGYNDRMAAIRYVDKVIKNEKREINSRTLVSKEDELL